MPQYFRELGQRCDDANDWWKLTEEILNEMHYVYWTGLLGKEVKVMVKECELESDIMTACYDLGLSDGYGKSAYRTWALIKSFGANVARESMSWATFYRHRKILMAAGLRNADFYTGKVIPFNLDMRMSTDKVELAKPVESWDDLRSFLMVVNG